MSVFEARHRFNATSPESSFARTVTAQRRHRRGVDVARGCVLSRKDASGTSSVTIERRREWLAMLADVFGLRLLAPPASVDALWARVRDAHQTWNATEAGSAAHRG